MISKSLRNKFCSPVLIFEYWLKILRSRKFLERVPDYFLLVSRFTTLTFPDPASCSKRTPAFCNSGLSTTSTILRSSICFWISKLPSHKFLMHQRPASLRKGLPSSTCKNPGNFALRWEESVSFLVWKLLNWWAGDLARKDTLFKFDAFHHKISAVLTLFLKDHMHFSLFIQVRKLKRTSQTRK